MKVTIKIEGHDRAIDSMRGIEKQLVDIAYGQACHDLGDKIGELTKEKTPLDKGDLRGSFTVQKIGDKWVCGYNTEYAAYQHQGMDKNGDRIIINRPSGGQSFFLSQPVQANKVVLLKFLQQRFDLHLNKIIAQL